MKRGFITLFALFFLMASGSALASSLILPSSLTAIQNNAFYGDITLTSVTFGENVKTIGESAFSGCSKLSGLKLGAKVETIGAYAFENTGIQEITLGSSMMSIGQGAFKDCKSLRKVVFNNPDTIIDETAFEGCENVAFACKPGSAVWHFADEHGFVLPGFRALLVGQNSYSSKAAPALYGCVEDARHMAAMLEDMDGTKFDATVIENTSISKIKTAVSAMRPVSGTDQDVTLFYYAGHGMKDGSLVGIGYNGASNFDKMTPAALKTLLDTIPGEKVVIIDACFSGGLIGKGEDTAEEATFDEFSSAFMAPFKLTERSGELARQQYHVMVACSQAEKAYSFRSSDGACYGVFTYSLMEGVGYDRLGSESRGTAKADTDSNGELTAKELFDYAAERTTALVKAYNELYTPVPLQNVQYYSNDPNRVIFIPSD